MSTAPVWPLFFASAATGVVDRLARRPSSVDISWIAGTAPLLAMTVIVVIFTVAAVFGVADIHTFHAIPDIVKPPRQTHMLRQLPVAAEESAVCLVRRFRGGDVFRRQLHGAVLDALSPGTGEDEQTGIQVITVVAPNVRATAVAVAWGRAADRMGKKPVFELAALGLVPVGLGWCFMTHGGFILGFILSALGGVLWCGMDLVNFNMVLEMSADKESVGDSSYVAVNTIIVSIAGCLGGLTAGSIGKWMQHWHWQPVAGLKIFTSTIFCLCSARLLRLVAVVVFLPHIHEPKAQPTRQTLGFMTANIYNNLFSCGDAAVAGDWAGEGSVE